MEQTEYFKQRLEEPDRQGITVELCEEVVRKAEYKPSILRYKKTDG